jgi:hypothetical protein
MDSPASGRQAPAPALHLAALLTLLTLALGLGACGGDDRDAARERAEAYIESEQAVMGRAQPDFDRANQAYLAFAEGELEPEAAAEQLADAERAIRDARDGVLVLDPPPEARSLHASLLEYLDMNVELAGETTLLVRYVPAAAGALAPLDRANRRLQARLAEADDGEAQARVLERFAASVGSIAADLGALEPPALREAVHTDQLRRLAATRRLTDRLRRALQAEDAERVSVLLKRFRSATTQPSARRLLTNQSVAHYHRQLRRVAAAHADVLHEQRELARGLS